MVQEETLGAFVLESWSRALFFLLISMIVLLVTFHYGCHFSLFGILVIPIYVETIIIITCKFYVILMIFRFSMMLILCCDLRDCFIYHCEMLCDIAVRMYDIDE